MQVLDSLCEMMPQLKMIVKRLKRVTPTEGPELYKEINGKRNLHCTLCRNLRLKLYKIVRIQHAPPEKNCIF